MHLKPIKVGMAVGGFAAVMHILWSAIVALGWGQAWLDFIFNAHMIKPVLQVQMFDFATALTLIIVTAVVGLIAGFIFAHVWNGVGAQK